MIYMKLRKLLAVLMLSVFCFSGCSNQLKEVSEMEKEIEQTTTTAATTEKIFNEQIRESESEPDMSEKWEVVFGGEDSCDGVRYESYAFINESGYQFACSVFLPKTAKNGMNCPVVLMNNGIWTGSGSDEGPGVYEWFNSTDPEILLADALREADMGMIVIEPFGSPAVYGTLLGAADVKGESRSDVPYAKGDEYNNSLSVDKAYTDIVLDNLGNIPGVDPSQVILASRKYHNITVTKNAIQNQERIKGLLMIDPCMDRESGMASGYMASDYIQELKEMNLKTEAGKLNTDTKIFFSKEKVKDDVLVSEDGTPALIENAKNVYPNSAPEILDTTDFYWEHKPSDEKKHSIKTIVSYCNNIFEK